MAIDGYKNYYGKMYHNEISINGNKILALVKEDDEGALYRKEKEFSLDYGEFLSRYYDQPYSGILLKIDPKSCYAGNYYISYDKFISVHDKREMSKRIPIQKLYIKLSHWTKVSEVGLNIYVNSGDKYWRENIERHLYSSSLDKLKDKEDYERYVKELNAGVYGQPEYIQRIA